VAPADVDGGHVGAPHSIRPPRLQPGRAGDRVRRPFRAYWRPRFPQRGVRALHPAPTLPHSQRASSFESDALAKRQT
jgi:hypothetical protein